MAASRQLGVFVHNKAGRKGVPLTRSFESWVRAALAGGRRKARTQVNIVLFDEAAGRDMNRQYRGKDQATNVLSFTYEPLPQETSGLLGDIVMCPPVIAREAASQGKPLRDHYAHLTVHGVLHLLGHDHENPAEAARMESLEIRILEGLQIRNPYI
jgi:probable rRNA maturation factor